MSPLKKTLIELLIGIPVVFGTAALLDFLYQTFITKNAYHFNLSVCIYCIGIWFAVEIVCYTIRSNKQKEEEQEE